MEGKKKKWLCKYHVLFTQKYRRKITYNQYRASIQEMIKRLCKYKGVEIFYGLMMPNHVHLVLSISLKIRVDLSQYLGHILVETAKTFSLFLNLQTPVELSNESNYGFDYDYKILQCS
ncbi:transposase [Enterococcus mundtii]|nr:transposase [Enterococcus mundtii]MCA6775470.1 transposase [Enterococcus mundtii]